MAQRKLGGCCHTAGETKDRKQDVSVKGMGRGDHYSEIHKYGVGLFVFFDFYFFNLDTGRTDFVTKMFVTYLWHKSLRTPSKMQKGVQNTCQRRSK